MSHAHTEIVLAEGLTVLTGPNNCGKSAIVVALDVLCNNISGDFMVRHQTKECYVTVELNETDVITWRRKGTVTSYEINGREIHRLGRGGIPEDLHKILKMPQIQSPGRESDPFEIHLAHQKAPIFLLDQPGSRAAMFFASSSDAEKLLRMQQRHRAKIRDARQAQIRNKATVEGLRARREILLAIDRIDSITKQAQNMGHDLVGLTLKRQKATQLISLFEHSVRRLRQIVWQEQCLTKLINPPLLYDTERLADLVERISHAVYRHVQLAAVENVICSLTQPPQFYKTPSLSELTKNLAYTQRKVNCLETVAGGFQKLQFVPKVFETTQLQKFIANINLCQTRYAKEADHVATFNLLQPLPQWCSIELLSHMVQQLQRAQTKTKLPKQLMDKLKTIKEPPVDASSRSLDRICREIENACAEVNRFSDSINLIADLNNSKYLDDISVSSSSSGRFSRKLMAVALIISSISVVIISIDYWPIQQDEESSLLNDQLIHEPQILTPNTIIRTNSLSEMNVSDLENERIQLRITIKQIESSIENSQIQLAKTKERLALIERKLAELQHKREINYKDRP